MAAIPPATTGVLPTGGAPLAQLLLTRSYADYLNNLNNDQLRGNFAPLLLHAALLLHNAEPQMPESLRTAMYNQVHQGCLNLLLLHAAPGATNPTRAGVIGYITMS